MPFLKNIFDIIEHFGHGIAHISHFSKFLRIPGIIFLGIGVLAGIFFAYICLGFFIL